MYNPDVHHRKSIRIKEYDYSKNGMYFITICTQNRKCILSEIMDGTLSDNMDICNHITQKEIISSDIAGVGSLGDPKIETAMSDIVGLCNHITPKETISSDIVGVGVPDDPNVKLSNIGKIVNNVINEMNEIYEKIQIGNYIIMPNHVHMIVEIYDEKGSSRTPTPTNAKLPFIISTLKRFSNKQIGYSIWQRNYYEHIIRNEKELYKIIEYIQYNPINWTNDPNYMA